MKRKVAIYARVSTEHEAQLSTLDNQIQYYDVIGKNIDKRDTKEGLSKIFDFINYSNKYFDENEPWKLAKENPSKCEDILYNCCNIILNINNLLKPYFVETTKSVEEYLKTSINDWNYKRIDSVNLSNEIKPLFIRYDKSLIDKEKEILNKLKH